MVKELGYGGRRAHRIAGTFVRMCRERGIKANEATGDILDEAAEFLDERPPKIDTQTLRHLLDPAEFIQTHNNVGGVAPKEARRMLGDRRSLMDEIKAKLGDRKARVAKGEELLRVEVDRIMES